MDPNLILFNLLGGTSLLLYGMRIAGEGLQKAAGSKLRRWLSTLTHTRLSALLVGAVVTAVIQSSSATTVMLVGLASAGLMSLSQTLGVILGADIGTTLTVQLLAFKILDYALLLIGVAVPMMFAFRRPQLNHLGQVLLGFGFIFLGLKLITETMAPLREIPLVGEVLLSLAAAPLLVVILSAGLTALIHSSAGTIAIALAFATQGLMPLMLSLPIVVGANIGTSATALISSLGAGTEARRVALAHALFKVIGAIPALLFLDRFAALVALTSNEPARQVANAHTIFNLALALGLLPFTGPLAESLRRLVPEERDEDAELKPRYLDPQVLDSPALAIGQATREALRVADIAESMVRDSIEVFLHNDAELLEEIVRRDDQIDYLEAEIKRYLTRLSEGTLTEELSRQEISLLYTINDLEHIGDIVSKSLLQSLGRKKVDAQATFSGEGMREIVDLHAKVCENLELAIAAYATNSRELADKVLRHKVRINEIERALRQAHIERLHRGLRDSIETSSIHLDVLNDLKRINSHATNIAYVVLGYL
jgi:phosphate:Na+ symporter